MCLECGLLYEFGVHCGRQFKEECKQRKTKSIPIMDVLFPEIERVNASRQLEEKPLMLVFKEERDHTEYFGFTLQGYVNKSKVPLYPFCGNVQIFASETTEFRFVQGEERFIKRLFVSDEDHRWTPVHVPSEFSLESRDLTEQRMVSEALGTFQAAFLNDNFGCEIGRSRFCL